MSDISVWNIGIGVFILFLFLSTAIFSFTKARKLHQGDFLYVGLLYLSVTIYEISLTLLKTHFLVILTFALMMLAANLLTQKIFYKDRRSGFKLITIIEIVLLGGQILVHLDDLFDWVTYATTYDLVVRVVTNVLSLGWLAYTLAQSLKILPKTEIEPWVVMRYRLLLFASIQMALLTSPELLLIPQNEGFFYDMRPWILFLQYLFMILSGSSFFIAWIMPDGLKRYLNQRSPSNLPASVQSLKSLSESEILHYFISDNPQEGKKDEL